MIISSDYSTIQNFQSISQAQRLNKSTYKDESSTPETTNQGEIEDKVDISKEAIALYQKDKTAKKNDATETEKEDKELSDQEKQKVQELKKRDDEVKAHEQAHISAGSDLITKGASYNYEKGPDNEKYAKSGDVSIDVSKEKEPQKTIEKAEQVKKAALAPNDPSGQDMKVAQKADQMIQQAQNELKNPTDKENTSKQYKALFTI